MTTSAEEFLASLETENRATLERLGQLSSAGEPPESLSIDRLLKIALKNELEAAEIAAIWLASTDELDVKLALARQCGDEARHYRLICDRLSSLGINAEAIDPRRGGYSPLFRYLASLGTTVERISAGQFTREGIALVRNQCFIDFCASRGDNDTAKLYEDIIQPDEQHHHQLGRRLLLRYALAPAAQELARSSAKRTLELAEEIQEMARLRLGISRAPGC